MKNVLNANQEPTPSVKANYCTDKMHRIMKESKFTINIGRYPKEFDERDIKYCNKLIIDWYYIWINEALMNVFISLYYE
jgi:hypothetical protein